MADVQASSSQFFGNETDVINRKLQASTITVSSKRDLDEFYEISKCVDVINGHNFQKIALQFPDSLLVDSTAVASSIGKRTGKKVFVLADTSYGSCCVDEVAAEHVNADVIIHYGRACLSKTRRLPVLYIFGKWPISVRSCTEEFGKLFPDPAVNILVFYNVVYSHCIGELVNSIRGSYPNVIFTKLKFSKLEERTLNEGESSLAADTEMRQIEENEDHENKISETQDVVMSTEENMSSGLSESPFCRFGREFTLPGNRKLEEYDVFYVGGESLCLTNLMMSLNKCQFYSYDPCSGVARQETANVNRALMKRYYMIQRAKDAQVVGIVVGTLGVADYLQAIDRLKQIIKLAGKKSYLFVMGKLNVAKMANFMEIDVFVLVACPENTLIDSQEFFKPVVTPFEMEIACLRAQEWTGDYITDFRELLPGASHSVDLNKEDMDDFPDISLVTGHLRPTYSSPGEGSESASMSLVQRNEEMTLSTQHHTSGAEFLASRSWKGLEQKLGESTVTKAVQGRTGIAAGYTHEKESDQGNQESTSHL